MEQHVFLTLIEATMVTVAFDLWMSQGGFNIFFGWLITLIKNGNNVWHVIINIFEVHEISKLAMVNG
jgi:hypothetical protein